MVVHQGGCHCGAVRFEVDAPGEIEAQLCNCSICSMVSYLHLIVPKSRFRLLTGTESITTYTFNTGVAQHSFCTICGIKSFYVPRSNPEGISVNVRCLKPDTIRRVKIESFDGRHWEKHAHELAHLTSDPEGWPSMTFEIQPYVNTNAGTLQLSVLEGEYAVWKLPPTADIPIHGGPEFLAITRTPDELSGVSPAHLTPRDAHVEAGWRCIRVAGPLAFELTGILSSIATPLARAGISIFAVSTYDTDYVLIPATRLDDAVEALGRAGHIVESEGKK